VFVSFDAEGDLERVYVPGILDGDFRDGARRVRLSRAADGNVPMTENAVKGCIGSEVVEVCHYTMNDGGHLLADCPVPLELIAGSNALAGNPSPILTSLFASQLGSGRDNRFGGFSGGGLYDPGGGGDDKGPDDGNSPPSVPLPTPLILLLTAILGLHGLRRIVGRETFWEAKLGARAHRLNAT
jgi:hypothetical protein